MVAQHENCRTRTRTRIIYTESQCITTGSLTTTSTSCSDLNHIGWNEKILTSSPLPRPHNKIWHSTAWNGIYEEKDTAKSMLTYWACYSLLPGPRLNRKKAAIITITTATTIIITTTITTINYSTQFHSNFGMKIWNGDKMTKTKMFVSHLRPNAVHWHQQPPSRRAHQEIAERWKWR